MIHAAHAAVQVQGSRVANVYRRLVVRRGVTTAMMAVAHRILTTVPYLARNHEPYRELTTIDVDDRQQEGLVLRMQQRIERLGYVVSSAPMTEQAA